MAPTGMVYCPRAPRWIVKAVRAIGVAGWGGGVWTHSVPRGRLEAPQESSEEQPAPEIDERAQPWGWSGLTSSGGVAASVSGALAQDVVVGLGGGAFGGTIMSNESFSWTLSGWRRSIREATEREDAKQLRLAFDREEMSSGYDTPTGGAPAVTAAAPLDRHGGASLASTLSLTTRSPWAIVGALAAWLEDRFFPLFGAEEAESVMAAAEGEMPRTIRTGASSASSVSGSLVDDETAANRRLHAALLRHGGMVRDKRVEALQYVLDQMIDPFCRAVLASFASAATDSAATLLGPLLFLYGHAYQIPREEARSSSDDNDHVLMEEDSANMPRAIAALRTLTELYGELFSSPMVGFGRSRGSSSNALNYIGPASYGATTGTGASTAVPLGGFNVPNVFSTNDANKTSSRGSLSDAGEVVNAFATRAELVTGLSGQNEPQLSSSLTTEPAASSTALLRNAAVAAAAPISGASTSNPDASLVPAALPADLETRPQSTTRPPMRASARPDTDVPLSGPVDMAPVLASGSATAEGDRAPLLEAALARVEALERELDFLNRELATYRDECVSGNRDLHNCVDAWTAIVLSETRSVAASERASIRSLARRLRKLERHVFGENTATGLATSPEHSVRGESLGAQRVVGGGGMTFVPESATPSIPVPDQDQPTNTTVDVVDAPAVSRMAERRFLYSEMSSDDPAESQGDPANRQRGDARNRSQAAIRSAATGPVGAISYLMGEHGSFGSDEDPLLAAFQRAVGLGSANGSGEDTGESAPSTPQAGTPMPAGLHGPVLAGLHSGAISGSLPIASGPLNAALTGLHRSTSGSNVGRTASPMLADPFTGPIAGPSSLPATSGLGVRDAAAGNRAVASGPYGRHASRRILRDGKWIIEDTAGSQGASWGTASASRASRREREAVLRRQIESMHVALEEERQLRRSLEERLAGR
ncbi:hypothetical protein CCYA_CCYA01G0017 [Cyanidiococcus yangmingshanensis]|nr:hypothetical protein CCYA_CCYA01G0017 [Cyanidiococcus yangmingshanensis]